MKHSVSLVASVAAILAASPAIASPIEDAPAVTGPVVVTATRTALPVDEVLAPMIVISREELERSPAADAADVLRFHAGVEIARNGGPGQTASVFLRGTDSNHTLVLVDGVRINPGTIGLAPLQNLSPDLIERIEVVKGPRSTLYGSDAIGGVINVITRAGTGDQLRLQIGGGSYGTRDASASGALAGSAGQLSFGAAWLDSAGFPTRSDDQTDRGYRNLSANVAARTEVGGVDLAARVWHAEGTSEYSDFFLTPVDQDFRNTAASLEARFEPVAGLHARVAASLMQDWLQQNQANFLEQNDFLRTHRRSLDWQNDFAAGRHHALTAGLLLQRETAESLSYGDAFDAGTDVDLYYLQDRYVSGRHRALVAIGLTDHQTFGTHVTWNAEYGFEFRPGTSAYAIAGTAFRAPDATDRYGYGGNPALQPERSRSYEAGFRHHPGPRQTLAVGLFRNELSDLIQYVVTDPDTYAGENRNVDRARIQGLEASWAYEGELWRARAGITLQDPRDLSNDTQLLRRARQNYTLSLSRRIGAHELALDLLHAGERHDFGIPAPVPLAAYTLVSLAATVAVTPAMTFTARLENLLDEQYELAQGYNTPGRSLFVAARYDFR